MKESFSTIVKYLSSLDEKSLKLTVSTMAMSKTQRAELTGGCGTAPTTKPTPNGDWVCRNGQWVWIAEIG